MWVLRNICDHVDRMAIRTTDYCSETVTCTKIDHEIICTRCGKVIVRKQDFDVMKDLFTK